MKRIGITGGIGSGKTTVCRIFETLGVPVYYADAAAKRLLAQDEQLKADIIARFGQVYSEKGELITEELAKVFSSESDTEALNQLVHPAVARDFEFWCNSQTAPYVVKEAALIFESGSDQQLDTVYAIDSPEEERIARVTARDGSSPEEVQQRMARQMPVAEKLERADGVIVNDGSTSLVEQVMAIHNPLSNG